MGFVVNVFIMKYTRREYGGSGPPNGSLNNGLYCWLPVEMEEDPTLRRVQGGCPLPCSHPRSFPRAPLSTSPPAPALPVNSPLALQAPGILSFLLVLPGISHLARPQLRGLNIWQHKRGADGQGGTLLSFSVLEVSLVPTRNYVISYSLNN